MNKAERIALSGITGTSFMTLFSYIVSELEKENFSEPEHLGTMFNRLIPAMNKKNSLIAGWGAHYAVGLLFALVYAELWEAGKIKPTLKNRLLLGGISGTLAVLIWKITFKLHPAPPWVNFTKYYTQLVPAHVVFALFATLTFRFVTGNSKTIKKLKSQTHEN